MCCGLFASTQIPFLIPYIDNPIDPIVKSQATIVTKVSRYTQFLLVHNLFNRNPLVLSNP